MIAPFVYARAASAADAAARLRADPDAKLLAGGQSLLAAMKLGLAMPSALVDLGRIPTLTRLERDGGGLWIGAMCSHARIAASAEVRAVAPMLARLAGGIGDPQVRNRGTIGGSVANFDPAADWPAGLLAAGATIATDRRTVAADDFFLGLFTTALEPDEVVTGFRVPALPDPEAVYLKVEQPASRFALVGVAVARRADGVRIAVTGLGNGVFRARAHEAALTERFASGSLGALAGAGPIAIDAGDAQSDLHASAEYRAHLADVLIRRAVDTIAGRAADMPPAGGSG